MTPLCPLLLVVLLALNACTADKQREQTSSFDVETEPISAFKRFYSWEDAKRAAAVESEDGVRNKRKQFYAWAGKRSAAAPHHYLDTSAVDSVMQKRKQFYAWAGK
uniref:RxLR effector protein n=1 Tax=Caenorhabditis japonica TaxID=281687 RepID=A0A8R1E1Q1_CAEJA